MFRLRVLDADGRLAMAVNVSVRFIVVTGPGRLIATHSGDASDQEPANSSTSASHHGLSRAYIRASEDSASPTQHRSRLAEIDLDGDKLTRTVQDASLQAPEHTVARAEAAGLKSAEVQIPTMRNLSILPLAVALKSLDAPLMLGDDPLAEDVPLTV